MKKITRRILLLLVLIGIAVLFFPALSKYLALRRELNDLKTDIRELKVKVLELEREEERILNDRDHLERLLREQMGLVKPGEIVYKVVPSEFPSGSLTPDGEKSSEN